MSSEFQRIARIRAELSTPSQAVIVGIGDDCAVLAASAHPRVWTVDVAVEGVHFERPLMDLEDVGFRSFMAAVSDLAAMGARPVAALSSLVLPTSFGDDDLERLLRGQKRAAHESACPVVGGNLSRGGELSITTTAIGECRGPVLLRSGAQPGDALYVTGPIGASALGLHALRAGLSLDLDAKQAIEHFLRPRARLDVSETIAQLAHSAVDLSDGLAQDAAHLSEASSVRLVIELERVPVIATFSALAARLSLDGSKLVLAGGEDYEILFTAPAGSVPSTLAAPIGRVEAGAPEVVVLDAAGKPVRYEAGFDHFR